jgi:MFS family permease
VVILMTPTLIQKLYAIAPADALAANSLATLGLALGCVVYGLAADRFGAARVAAVGCALLSMAVYALYFGLRAAPQQLNALYALTGFCVGVVGVIPSVLVRAFPPAVRFSGVSFAYNIAYAIFGGLTPLIVGALLKFSPLAPAHYVAALCLVGIAVALTIGSRARSVPSSA